MIGDILIRVLWKIQAYYIIDARLGDSDYDNHNKDTTKTLLDWWEKEKKENNVKHYHE